MMFKSRIISLSLALFAALVAAQSSTSSAAPSSQTIVVTVTNSSSASNASSVFTPSQITANLGDLVLFNFTQGNHTATQSAFFAPCESLNYTNGTNGFDSNFVVVPANFSTASGAFPVQAVPILESNWNTTMWFYDVNTCAEGGVGVINLVPGDPATNGQTLDGFRRNAVRLNGTSTSASSGNSSTGTSSGSAASTTETSKNSALGAGAKTGFLSSLVLLAVVPLFVL